APDGGDLRAARLPGDDRVAGPLPVAVAPAHAVGGGDPARPGGAWERAAVAPGRHGSREHQPELARGGRLARIPPADAAGGLASVRGGDPALSPGRAERYRATAPI